MSEDQASTDRPGRLIYIRDHDTGQVWSLAEPGGHLQVRHGIGYSTFEAHQPGLTFSARVFVPVSDPVELWEVKLTNTVATKRRLSLFFVAEWATDFDHCQLVGNALLATSRRQPQLVGLAAFDHALDSFETNRRAFFGRYHGYHNPQALTEGRLARSQGPLTGDGVAVLEKKITLGSKAEFNLAAIIGLVDSPRASERAKHLVKHYSDGGARQAALEKIHHHWQVLSGRHQLNSPDVTLNQRYNTWASYQTHQANHWPALGAYGQPANRPLTISELADHLMTALPDDLMIAERYLDALVRHQLKDGALLEFWEEKPLPHNQPAPDSAIALLLAAAAYLAETGQVAWLKTEIPYLDGGTGSALEHLNRAIKYLIEQLSPRHLLVTGHESLLLTSRLVLAFEQITPILEQAGEHHHVQLVVGYQQKLKTSLNKLGNGDSFPRELSPKKVGLKNQPFHQLDLATQLWALTAGVPDPKRGEKILAHLKKALGSQWGVADFAPAYSNLDLDNPLSLEASGTGSNGAISVTHNLLLARVLAKYHHGDELLAALAVADWLIPETISLNPASLGQANQRWSAPVAGWWSKVVLESLAGIQPTLGGLKVNPCLPRDWRHLEINRLFRGAEYHFRFHNPLRISSGVDRIVVDGSRLTGVVIAPFRSGSHFVDVFLG